MRTFKLNHRTSGSILRPLTLLACLSMPFACDSGSSGGGDDDEDKEDKDDEDEDGDKASVEDCHIPKAAKQMIEDYSLEVEVDEKGDKPRIAMRYEFSEGEVKVTETEKSNTEMQIQGQSMKERKETVEKKTFSVTEVDDEGVAKIKKVKTSTETNLDNGKTENSTENETFSITPCGYMFDYEGDTAFSPLGPPIFPDAALGEGAEWTVTYESKIDETWSKPVKAVVNFKITSIDDGEIGLEAEMSGGLKDAELEGNELKQMKVSAKTEATFELSEPYQVSKTEEVSMEMDMVVTQGRDKLDISMKMTASAQTE